MVMIRLCDYTAAITWFTAMDVVEIKFWTLDFDGQYSNNCNGGNMVAH